MASLGPVEADLAARERRERLFPRALFADPAWDLLLGLYRARLLHRPISITQACALAGVPRSTAMRWLQVLEREGLVERPAMADGPDAEEVQLTRTALDAFADYFAGR